MTNEVTTTGGAQLPAFLQAHLQVNKPSADVASLATSQNSTPRLSLRAKIFRFMEGQEEKFKSKDPVRVFIVGVEPGPGLMTKTFYATQYAGADSAGAPPDCSSADGVRPDPWIQQPVHNECKSCSKNQFGSATSRGGKPSKACHDSKRLYITREQDPMGTIYLSQVPVSSLKALAKYGSDLQSMGVEPWMVKTKLEMVDDSEFPELLFSVDGFIDESNLVAMRERALKREWNVARNLMLQAPRQQVALPAHLQQALGQTGAGGVPTSAAAPAAASAPVEQPVNNLAPPTVDPNLAAKAAAVTAGATVQPGASNADILQNW